MKKAIKVNISGAIFNLDEEAYAKLKAYLDKLNSYYSDDPDGKDIVEDIENRIAELLQEYRNGYREVIILSDVEQAIEVLGYPFEEMNEETHFHHQKSFKQVYRNPEDRIIGGVCGGLGAYFGVDSNWIRLAFALSIIFLGVGTLLYIVLWILIPLAQTSTDLLEMRGEAVTIRNIEKAIKNEFEKVKKNWKNRNSSNKQSQQEKTDLY